MLLLPWPEALGIGIGNGIAIDEHRILTVDHSLPDDGVPSSVWLMFNDTVVIDCEYHNIRLPDRLDEPLKGTRRDIVRMTRASDEFKPGDWKTIW